MSEAFPNSEPTTKTFTVPPSAETVSNTAPVPAASSAVAAYALTDICVAVTAGFITINRSSPNAPDTKILSLTRNAWFAGTSI